MPGFFPKGKDEPTWASVQADRARETALTYLHRFVEREPALAAGSPVTLMPAACQCAALRATGGRWPDAVGDAARQVDPLTGGHYECHGRGPSGGPGCCRGAGRGEPSARGWRRTRKQATQLIGRRLARNYRLRERIPPDRRASRDFVRLFAVAAGGK